MKRIHLFELEDQKWFPAFLRDYGTDYLRFIANQFDIFKGIVPLLRKALRHADSHHIVDLASGGGGGWKKLHLHLKEDFPDLKITLTDYYPNVQAFRELIDLPGGTFDFRAESVNAMAVPADLKGLRTQFLSFHHFRPEDAFKILQNAVNAKQPIAIFEVTERRLVNFIPILLSPLTVLAFTPFIRPFRIGRIFFTYLFPIVLPFVLGDGMVSILRSYSVKEMRAMVEKVDGWESYEWEIGRKADGPGAVLHLIGWPKTSAGVKGPGEHD